MATQGLQNGKGMNGVAVPGLEGDVNENRSEEVQAVSLQPGPDEGQVIRKTLATTLIDASGVNSVIDTEVEDEKPTVGTIGNRSVGLVAGEDKLACPMCYQPLVARPPLLRRSHRQPLNRLLS